MTTHATRTNLRFQSDADRLRLAARMAEEAELIGGRIKELRERLGMTQRELASKLAGKTEAKDISRWENGKHVPESATMSALAEALSTSVLDLRAGPEAKRHEPKQGDLDQLTGSSERRETGDGSHHTIDEVYELLRKVRLHQLQGAIEDVVEAEREAAALRSQPPARRRAGSA